MPTGHHQSAANQLGDCKCIEICLSAISTAVECSPRCAINSRLWLQWLGHNIVNFHRGFISFSLWQLQMISQRCQKETVCRAPLVVYLIRWSLPYFGSERLDCIFQGTNRAQFGWNGAKCWTFTSPLRFLSQWRSDLVKSSSHRWYLLVTFQVLSSCTSNMEKLLAVVSSFRVSWTMTQPTRTWPLEWQKRILKHELLICRKKFNVFYFQILSE